VNKWYRLGKKYSNFFEGLREVNEFLRKNGMNFDPYSFDDFSEENYDFLCKYIDVYPETENYEYDRSGRRYMFEWGFLATSKDNQRKAKVQFTKSGGTAKGNAITNRITIPTSWIKELGITEENREVNIKLIDNKIVIEKIRD
jgi:hypothetical protein